MFDLAHILDKYLFNISAWPKEKKVSNITLYK